MRFTSPHLRTNQTVRVLLLLAVFVATGLFFTPVAHAQLGGSKTCGSLTGPASSGTVGETILCDLTITATAADMPANTTISVTAINNNYFFAGPPSLCTATGGTCVIDSVTTTAIILRCVTNPCTEITLTGELLTITSLTPNTITQRVSVSTPGVASINLTAAGFTISPPGVEFFVSTSGSDANNCESRSTACLTINRAHEVARDGDSIKLAPGTYIIAKTVRVTKLVRIEPDIVGSKVILKANPGITIFEIVAQGGSADVGSNRHVVIANFTMGGNFKAGFTDPVIRLLNDNYTEISGNIIGAEDLPINNGIVLSNSDHATIANNTIQGSSQFVFSPVLVVGKTTTGFGIVSVECFGTSLPDVSDSVTIRNNLFTNLWVAGIWMCSDGAGEHQITSNVFRNNWRGIVLKDTTDTLVNLNTLIDDRNDGIILYGASLHNTIQGNRVESHVAADAAGIRIGWVADPLVPLDNLVDDNQLVRVTVAIHVFGARTTVITNNDIKVSGARTAILLTPSTTLGDPGTQPYDTEIANNIIIFTGPCTPVIGCGLRLLGVVVPVLAINNNWGLRRIRDVEAVIWHQLDDPAVGCVLYTPFLPTVLPDIGIPTPLCGLGTAPISVATPAATATASATPANSSATATQVSAGNAPITSVSLSAGCSTIMWPGASGVSVADMALGITPAAAQQTATIWRRDNGEWRGYGSARDLATDVFTIRGNDPLMVCVSQSATWLIPTQVGGP